jgi:hypothetical protein
VRRIDAAAALVAWGERFKPNPGEEWCVRRRHDPPPLPRLRGNDAWGRFSCGDQADLVPLCER